MIPCPFLKTRPFIFRLGVMTYMISVLFYTPNDDVAEVIVIYENGVREKIWAFNPTRYIFDYRDFVGKTKIEAVFYCDRKSAE